MSVKALKLANQKSRAAKGVGTMHGSTPRPDPPRTRRAALAAADRALALLSALLRPWATTDPADPFTAAHHAVLKARGKVHIAQQHLQDGDD